MKNWNPMGTAPKDIPILALCSDQCCEPKCGTGGNLCIFHAHAEGLSKVDPGPHVIVWGGGWADGYEDGGGSLPDWWFRHGSYFEEAANPIGWSLIPEADQ